MTATATACGRTVEAERQFERHVTAQMTMTEATTSPAVACPLETTVKPLRAAYADPPYLGCGVKHYGTRHDQAAEYDNPEAHRRLIERLCDEFDCWALSLHEPSLRTLLAMCPDDVRVGSWVKPFAAFKANVTRAWTWEPVIFRFARDRTREQPTWRDHVSAPIAMRKGFPGAKPEAFSFWVGVQFLGV
jgi:hypothetical protein